MTSPWFKRVLPFAVYILFILLKDILKPFWGEGTSSVFAIPVLYSVATVSIVLILAWFWNSYDELQTPSFNILNLLIALITGVIVFVLWINMDWDYATTGVVDGFNPYLLPANLVNPFIAVRMFGTSLVVPIFEELFWRSFILRYIVNPDFTAVKLGTFSWSSFLISSLLFGLEHHLWLAGIMAGLLYSLLLYCTRNLFYCILAHGVTNFLLGLYILNTGNFQFW